MIERAEAIGPCSRPYDFQVVDEPSGLWTIALTSPLISVFALLLLRKQGEKLDPCRPRSRFLSDGTDGPSCGQFVSRTPSGPAIPRREPIFSTRHRFHMMFVHASLKDTVFGIDENLRKTFGTALFTSAGVVLFIVGCELMEGALNLPGVYGGLVMFAFSPSSVLERILSKKRWTRTSPPWKGCESVCWRCWPPRILFRDRIHL